MSLTNAQFNQERPELLNEKHQNVLNNIQKLQEIEKYMFQNLERINNQGGDSTAETQAIEKINELTETRINLFNQLKDVYSSTQNELNDERNMLANQIAITNMVENELNNLKTNTQQLRSNKSNKLRLVEIGDYESKRYNAHIGIMKIIATCSVIILIASILHKNYPIPAVLTTIIIIGTMVVGTIMIIIRVIDLMRRNNMDFDQYDFAGVNNAEMKKGYETVLQHDKAFFSKLEGDAIDEYNRGTSDFESQFSNIKKEIMSDASQVGNDMSNAMDNAKNAISNTGNAQPDERPVVESFASNSALF